jgi:hypothetical protein
MRKALNVGEKIIVQAEILKNSKKILEVYAKAVTEDNVVVTDATGKLMKIDSEIKVLE